MFLSKLVLNIRDRQARRDLARPYEMHRTLMNGYPYPRVEDRCDLLFRVEPSRTGAAGRPRANSRSSPTGRRLPAGYLAAARPSASRSTCPFAPGQRLRFRLRANPTKRVAATRTSGSAAVMAGQARRRLATPKPSRFAGCSAKGEAGGFRIPGEWVDANIPRRTSRSSFRTSASTSSPKAGTATASRPRRRRSRRPLRGRSGRDRPRQRSGDTVAHGHRLRPRRSASACCPWPAAEG